MFSNITSYLEHVVQFVEQVVTCSEYDLRMSDKSGCHTNMIDLIVLTDFNCESNYCPSLIYLIDSIDYIYSIDLIVLTDLT